jgi:predicted lipoprotein
MTKHMWNKSIFSKRSSEKETRLPYKKQVAWTRSVSSVLFILGSFACDGGFYSSEEIKTLPSHILFLENVADAVVIPTFEKFRQKSIELEDATKAYFLATDGSYGDQEQLRLEAQLKWNETMALWQQAELMQVGPSGPVGLVGGGASARDEIYSWPTLNPCAIDQQIVTNEFQEPNFFSRKLVNIYGLDSLEYVLFHESPSNQCSSPSTINQNGSWAALEEDSLRYRRAAYAFAAAKFLRENAESLLDDWDPNVGNFRASFVMDDENGAPIFESSDAALNDVFRALYYLEVSVKDRKLAIPAGLTDACPQDFCLDSLESQWADRNNSHIENNLLGFRDLFTGKDGIGFDDLLEDEGAEDLSTDIIAKTDLALETIRGLDNSMPSLLQEDPNQVVSLFHDIKNITDLMKEQFTGILNVQIPIEGAGDTD